MKKLLILILTTLSIHSFSQEIIENKIDRFTKERIIKTSFERIALSTFEISRNDAFVQLVYADSTIYMIIKWTCGSYLSIDKDAEILFLDSLEHTYTFYNSEYTIASLGAGTVTLITNTNAYGVTLYLYGNISHIKDKIITYIRFYTSEGYHDIKINTRYFNVLQNLYSLLENEINKTNTSY